MIWTHFFDLLLKAGAFVLIIILALLIPGLMDDPIRGMVLIFVLWVLSLIFIVRTPGSWLYCRIRLKMPITFSQASKLNGVLSPNPFRFHIGGNKWLPMKEVLLVERDMRYQEALRIATAWLEERERINEERKQEMRNATGTSKIFTGLIVAAFVFCIVTAFAELPPATYYIRWYCRIFDTDRYPVLLIACLMILTIIGPIALIKKIKERS